MTKEFTAKQMHNAPGQVFRAADKDGVAKISHEHYKDRDFFLTARDKEAFSEIFAGCVADNLGLDKESTARLKGSAGFIDKGIKNE
jgi:hypothetical protein